MLINKEMFGTYNKFWNYVLDNYDEEKQLTIEFLISYYVNKQNGFGHNNCEISYEECIKFDITGELNKLALIGAEFENELFNRTKSRNCNKII